MIFTLRFNTTTPVTLTGLSFLGGDGTAVSPSSISLTKGSAASGWDTLLLKSDNQTSVVLTPDGNVTFSVDLPSVPSRISIKARVEQLFSLDFTGGEISLLNNVFKYKYLGDDVFSVLSTGFEIPANYVDPNTASTYKSAKYFTTAVFTSGSVTEGSTIRFGFLDTTNPAERWTSWRTVSVAAYTDQPVAEYNVYGMNKSHIKLRERSSLANLYASQAPVITGIDVYEYSSSFDKVIVKVDKVAQVVLYVMTDDSQLNETNILFFARDEKAYVKEHTYYVPKLSGKNKIIAIPTLDSYAKDFENRNALNSLGAYNYSTSQLVVSRYDEGYKDGFKKAYQDVYALGNEYGFSFDFNTRTDYGTTSVNAQFMQVVADGQYIKASREFLNRAVPYGFTYNSASTDRTYYANQQTPYINKLTSSGAIEAYQSLYSRGATYGFLYDNTQTNKTYYQNKEAEFISKLDTFSTAKGYKTAYSELFTAGRSYEGSTGIPVGSSLWVDDTSTNPNFASKKDEFIRHVYNTGYVKAKQETFDRGLPYGFDFRNFVNTSKLISDPTVPQDYLNLGPSFIDTVTAQSKSTTFNEVYTYIKDRYGFIWDAVNSANLSPSDYVTYLSGLKPAMVTRVNEASRIAAYNEVFTQSATDYQFVYNTNSTSPAYYQGLIDASYKAAYNYGARAAYQDIYDQGTTYNFDTLTQYRTYRKPGFGLKVSKNDSTTDYFHGISQVYTEAVRDFGSVFTYKGFFNLAGEYGFTYDTNQSALSYYGAKRQEFLDVFSSGNYSEGIRTVFQAAESRYGFKYTFSPKQSEMEAQISGMFDFQENKLKADSYRFVLEAMGNETFYNIQFTDTQASDALKSQIVPNLLKLKDSAGKEAYNYVFITANSRVGYTYPNTNLSASALKGYVIPMFKYVEDYKEADAYRRVHNYAKTFLNIGYTFQDSTDPRVLENQVPGLFDFLNKNGGYAAYKYVHDTAHRMFEWNYTDDLTVGTLKTQIVPMFEFINSSFVDIKSISQPTFEWPNRVVFEVELNRPAGVYAILVDKLTNEHIAGFSNMTPSLQHSVKFGVSPESLKKPTGVVIIPTPRNIIA